MRFTPRTLAKFSSRVGGRGFKLASHPLGGDAGLAKVRGFAVNVSNYYKTTTSISYAANVNAALGAAGKPFVIDTSRNGNGSNGVWCNPAGRKLGSHPQVGGGAEMLLWIKTVGTSDGLCGTAPTTPAGTFNPDLAMRLISGT